MLNIQYCDAKGVCLTNADALILLTEWKEFSSPNFELIKDQLINPIIFDGRNH